MAYKYFGKLSGSTFAALAANDTTSRAKRAPYKDQAPGTKFLATGEDATSRNLNRVFTALSTNIDSLATCLDAPALRDDVLHYFDNAATGLTGSGKYGFPALAVTNPGASGNYAANLGITDTGTSIGSPAVWLHVGLHKSALASGKQMFLYKNDLASNGFSRSYNEAIFAPTSVKVNGSASDFFGTQTYLGVSAHSPADSIPPIAPVASDIAPYGDGTSGSGISQGLTIASWSGDGLTVASNSYAWSDLYARAGCFVDVTGSNANNGLYLVRQVAGRKVVLTTGNLIKVTVGSGVGVNFASGQLVSWGADAPAKLDARKHYAYVVYKSEDTLYLSALSGGESLGGGTNPGSTVASTVTTSGGGVGAFAVASFGDSGLVDDEVNANDSSILPVGSLLSPVAFSSVLSTTGYAVLTVRPAGAPVAFDVNQTLGTATLCAPLGFLLNPVLVLPASSSTSVVKPGNYFVACKTLTTVREQLLSGGNSIDTATSEDPSASMAGHLNDYAQLGVRTALQSIKYGNQAFTSDIIQSDPWYSATRAILGPSTWVITATNISNAAPYLSTSQDGLAFTHPSAAGTTYATYVASWGDRMVVRDVHRVWTDPEKQANYEDFTSVAVGSTIVANAVTYTASAVVAPHLKSPSTYTIESPPPDLNSAYNNYFSANSKERAAGSGNVLRLLSGKPLTMTVPTGSSGETAVLVVTNTTETVYPLVVRNKAGTIKAAIRSNNGTMEFHDENTASNVPFSSAVDTALDPTLVVALGDVPSVIGAINHTKDALAAYADNTYLSGAAVSIVSFAGPPLHYVLRVTAGTFLIGGRYVQIPTQDLPSTGLADGDRIFVVARDNAGTYEYALETVSVAESDVLLSYAVATITLVPPDYITSFGNLTDLRAVFGSKQSGTSLSVGTAAGSHFASIGAAVTFIETFVGNTPGHGANATQVVPSWEIVVRGKVTEASTIRFYQGNITIRGIAADADDENSAIVAWSAASGTLFDTHGQNNITFRDLTIVSDASNDADPDNRRAVIDNKASTTSTNVMVQNIKYKAFVGARVHTLVNTSVSGFRNLRISDVDVHGTTDNALYLNQCSNVWVTNCSFAKTFGAFYPVRQINDASGGIFVGAVDTSFDSGVVALTNVLVAGYPHVGIYLLDAPNVKITNCTVDRVVRATGAGGVVAGIVVLGTSTGCLISGCTIKDVGHFYVADDTLYGISVASTADRATIVSNDVDMTALVLDPADPIEDPPVPRLFNVDSRAINVAVTTDTCTVIGNIMHSRSLLYTAGSDSTGMNNNN